MENSNENNEKIKTEEVTKNDVTQNHTEKTEQTEQIEQSQKTKVEKNDKKKSKLRMFMVLAFVALFALVTYVMLRGSFLEYKELGENFVDTFWTNLKYKYIIMAVNFATLYVIMYFTGRGIKKGLKVFFDQEKKAIPKLPNKSISLIVSAIVSVVMSAILTPKIQLALTGASFGTTDPIFNLDIGYYVFIRPLVQIFIIYFIALIIGLSAYMALYYILVFNIHFDGIDRATLKNSSMMKKLIRNVKLLAIGIAAFILVNTQNILFQKYLTLDNDVDLVGAGLTQATVQLWGYAIFAIVILVAVWKGVKYFNKGENRKIIKCVAVIPTYLVALFIVMVGFNLIYVKTNQLDKEKEYISYSIENTKKAYDIDIEEENVDYSGTVTSEETKNNQEIIDNTTIVSKDAVLKTLEDSQTETGYYSYRNATIGNYKVNGKNQLVYLSPREIISNSRTYNNKTYEYTHGMGEIVVSSTSTTDGAIQYIQNDISGEDDQINIKQPRIYFGLETTNTIATNTVNKTEFDYTDEDGTDHDYSYDGDAGLQLGFWDRLILGIRKGDVNLAFSSSITKDSKLLINRNIIERAKKALPDVIYDDDPYTVVDDDGNILWVLDAYTVSSEYPYSSYISIEYDGAKQKINYMRNSIKVIINSYTGEMKFYITDRTDPIAMAYRTVYPTLFEDIDEEIPTDISKNFVYSNYLYDIQSQMLKTFHNVKTDVLYRSDDIWDFAKYNTTQTTKSTGSTLEPYYTMVKDSDGNSTIGLVRVYTPEEKQNIISYLVGTCDGSKSTLKLYKFSADSSILGPMQLDKQIEQDETISAEINALNVTGTKISKEMIIVPIENTLLYVEPIYQTMLNESDIPILKKVVVASGNKVAIGSTLKEALNNLLSQSAVNIDVENTDDMSGLIDAIIKANNNLTDSNKSNDWEQMGSDVKKLQELINSLETLKKEEEQKAEKAGATTEDTTNTVEDQNEVNTNKVSE